MLLTDIKSTLDGSIHTVPITIGDTTLNIVQYLPAGRKAEFIQWVLEHTMDVTTGMASPLRSEIYFGLAIAKWYADIEIPEDMVDTGAYDLLIQNDVLDTIIANIPSEEYSGMVRMTNECIEAAERYTLSFAGMMQNMQADTDNLSEKFRDITERLKNREGIEVLSEIKNIMGKED